MSRDQFLTKATERGIAPETAERMMGELERAHALAQRGRFKPAPLDWSTVEIRPAQEGE